MDIASIADWTDPKQVNTRRGPRLVRHATPDERFWHAWKMDKPAVKEAGVSLKKKDDGTWEATLWEELPQEEQKAMVAAIESSRAVDADISVPSPDGLEYLPFQRAGIAYAAGKRACLIGDEMGLGKSIQAAGLINYDESIKKVLVVCPASLRLNWERELKKWLVRDFSISVINGGKAKDWVPAEITIANYDIVGKHRDRIDEHGPYDLMILDEAHYLKNQKATRTKAVYGKKGDKAPIEATRVLALTGTPIQNRPLELWPFLEYADPCGMGSSFFGYAKRYCNPPEAPIWMGDMSFKDLGDVQVGDEVIGWDKRPRPPSRNRGKQTQKNPNLEKRCLVKTGVLEVHRRTAAIVKVTMASGRVIRCTPDHRWLSGKSHGGSVDRFVPATFPGGILCHVVNPCGSLPESKHRMAAWLGGILDGEGTWPTIAQCPDHNPEVYARIKFVLEQLGIPFSHGRSRPGFHLTGGRATAIKFLNWCDPVKRNRIERFVLTTKFVTKDTIVSIVPDGEGEVIGLTTETGNYIAWGYCSKNCAAVKTRFGWDFSGSSNLDELQRRLRANLMCRRLKAEVLSELPNKRRQVIPIPANGASKFLKAEQKATAAMESELLDLRAFVELAKASGDEEAYREAEAEYGRRQQASLGEMAVVRRELAEAKVPYVVDHLTEALDCGPVVCFAHHRSVIAKIAESFDGRCGVITGDTPMNERQQIVDDFQAGRIDLFIGNIQAAGVGLTLTKSSHVVFAELDWVPGNLSQAEDRAHRLGQEESVLVQHIVFEDSLDETLAKAVVRKQDVIDAALDKASQVCFSSPVRVFKDKAASEDTTPDKLMEVGLGMTQVQKDCTLQCLRILAGKCDGAQSRDDIGFNGCDTKIGKSLAENSSLSPRQAALGLKIICKYHRQLPADVLAGAKC